MKTSEALPFIVALNNPTDLRNFVLNPTPFEDAIEFIALQEPVKDKSEFQLYEKGLEGVLLHNLCWQIILTTELDRIQAKMMKDVSREQLLLNRLADSLGVKKAPITFDNKDVELFIRLQAVVQYIAAQSCFEMQNARGFDQIFLIRRDGNIYTTEDFTRIVS